MISSSIVNEVLALRKKGGYALLDDFAVIEIKGNDASRLLQARTTNDLFSLKPGFGQQNAILNRTGHLLANFWLYKLNDCIFLVAEKCLISVLQSEIEKFRFRDELEVLDISDRGRFWLLEGPQTESFLMAQFQTEGQYGIQEMDVLLANLFDQQVMVMRKSLSGEEGFWLWLPKEKQLLERLECAAKEHGLTKLSGEALDTARIEAAQLKWGVDMSNDDLITDTGLEQVAVSYSKGCYLGQEVVARIKTYSAPRKGLVGLMFLEDVKDVFPSGAAIYIDGKSVGEMKSNTYSPICSATVALASLQKEYRCPGEKLKLEVEGSTYSVEVVVLPFYKPPSRQQRARTLYEEALSLFAANDELQSIELLRQALVLDPVFADGYEVLGVILSKQNHLDEAIELMHKLSKVDPDSIMAHSNLSVFYLQKGDKEKAEEEKAIAMSIGMQKLAKEAVLQNQQEKDKLLLRTQAFERMQMFEEVLAIDDEDLLANYGMGNAYVELEDFQKAIPYLQKAIQVKPSHTVAYLALGGAFQGVANIEAAISTYKKGIAIAARHGDMMPLKEMQMRLSQIENGTGSG